MEDVFDTGTSDYCQKRCIEDEEETGDESPQEEEDTAKALRMDSSRKRN